LRLPTKDVTGGFRVYDRAAIDLLLEQGTECDGYGFQVEGVYAVSQARMRIVEVPITFRDRAYGRSKMSRSIVWEATRRCVALAFQRPRVPAVSAQIAERATDGH
jgi:dolichol-phosphate mannosyltransferase